MKAWFKRGLFGLVVVFMVALIGAAVFLLTFDPNAYKAKLQEVVYERFQRTLTINGDIQLSLFPRIGLELSDVALSDRDSLQPFAAFDTARFSIAIWPLLSNEYVVDHMAVDGFQAWITRDHQGAFNFSDLLAKAEYSTPEAAHPEPSFFPQAVAQVLPNTSSPQDENASQDDAAAVLPPKKDTRRFTVVAEPDAEQAQFHIDIAGLALQNGQIHYQDQASNQQLDLVNVAIDTGRMTFGQFFDVHLKGQLQGHQPEVNARVAGQALVRLEPHLSRYAAQRVNVTLDGQLGRYHSSDLLIRGAMDYHRASNTVAFKDIELNSTGALQTRDARPKLEWRMTAPWLSYSEANDEFRLEKFVFRAKAQQAGRDVEAALNIPLMRLTDTLAQVEPIQGSIKRSGNNTWGVNLRADDFAGTIQHLTANRFELEGVIKRPLQAWQINLASPLTWTRQQHTLSWAELTGLLSLEDEGLADNKISTSLQGQGEWALQSQHASLRLKAFTEQQANSSVQLNTQYQYGQQPDLTVRLHAQHTSFSDWIPSSVRRAQRRGEKAAAEGVQDEAAPKDFIGPKAGPRFPFEWLQALNARATLRVDHSRLGRLALDQLRSDLVLQDGQLRIKFNSPEFYQGSLVGEFTANSQQRLTANLDAYEVTLKPLLTSIWGDSPLAGQSDLSLRFTTHGEFYGHWLDHAQGGFNLDIRDGEVYGLNAYQSLAAAVEVAEQAFQPQLPVLSDRFDAQAVTPFAAFSMQSAFQEGKLTITALSALSERLRLSMEKPTYINLHTGELHWLWVLRLLRKKANLEDPSLKQLVNVPVPMRITGSWSRPLYHFDWENIQAPVIQKALESPVFMTLVTAQNEAEQAQSTSDAALIRARSSAPAARSLGEAMKDLFGR